MSPYTKLTFSCHEPAFGLPLCFSPSGEIFAERTKVQGGEYAGCHRVKCLVRLYDRSINIAVRPAPIREIGEAVGYGYDLLTSAIGCAMQKTINAKHFRAEAGGGGNLEEAFIKLRYTLDRVI